MAPAGSPVTDDTDDRPATVVLKHGLFRRFADAHFQRAAGDGMPVLMVRLAEAPAALPIRSLQREFGIADDSADGIVLGMIGEALDFVGVLRIGDPFPPEVLSGNASWQPEPRHYELALGRLRNALVAWQAGEPPPQTDAAGGPLPSVNAPNFQNRLADSFRAAATELGLARSEDAVAMVEDLAQELAFIEFLREHLMVGMIRMQTVLTTVTPSLRADRNRYETALQVGRLLATAIARTRDKFEQIDTQTSEVMATLRNLPAQRAFIRSTRDFLHRSWRAFSPTLARWMAIDPTAPSGLRTAIDEAYAFLAPRFMSVQDWLDNGRRAAAAPQKNQMEW